MVNKFQFPKELYRVREELKQETLIPSELKDLRVNLPQ